MQDEGGSGGCEEVRGCYGIEEPQFEHPGEHVCVVGENGSVEQCHTVVSDLLGC